MQLIFVSTENHCGVFSKRLFICIYPDHQQGILGAVEVIV